MKKIIIGLIGEIAAGKDTVANYLQKKYHSETVSFSQPLRDIVDILGLPQTRSNLAWLGADLRARFGQDMMSRALKQKVINSRHAIVCIPNVRLPQDLTHLKNLPHFYLIAIATDRQTRYNRLTKRSQNADDRGKTWQQFLADAKLPTETKIRRLMKQAKWTLDNNGSVKDLEKQVDALMKKIKK